MGDTIWTVGHSNRSTEDLLDLLRGAGIEVLVDVRRFPRSRRHPWFAGPALAAALEASGVSYVHAEGLGGHRERAPGSPNTAWPEEAFNAYADHAATPAFQAALERLETLARRRRVAVMCAEAEPERCHRRVLADVLVARGWSVTHLVPPHATRPHAPPPFARIEGGRVTYPGGTLF